MLCKGQEGHITDELLADHLTSLRPLSLSRLLHENIDIIIYFLTCTGKKAVDTFFPDQLGTISGKTV